jgi:hypothetical protein
MRYREAVAAGAYLALAAAWVYLFLDSGFLEGHDLWWLVIAGFALAHVALGFVGRWPVVLLPTERCNNSTDGTDHRRDEGSRSLGQR